MKEDALQLASRLPSSVSALNFLREYVQACVLRSFHESRAFEAVSFVGGTALRFLYDLPRYSEDLDFSVDDHERYKPLVWLEKLKRDLMYLGFEAEISWNSKKPVHIAWIRIPGLLKEATLSSLSEQKLSIRVEFDSNPPAGAHYAKAMVNRHFLFAIKHYNLDSLMAGKVNALLTRPFTKGRDWYDFMWYRSRRPPVEPNQDLLAQSLKQFGCTAMGCWKEAVREKIASLNIDAIRADTAPFLERQSDIELITRDGLIALCD